ncbi:type II secretion system protein [Thiomicrorhabdus sp.]|uniref:type II secretion system protein n=1 Tax=Thiomicrorhabdus sp. TaxID=2039724 RepID=UPI003561C9A3
MLLQTPLTRIQRGFTLVEIAVVLAIIALIFGAGFSTLGAYIDNANQSHTKGSLEVTKRALLNYVVINKHMPCPDTDGDGSDKDERTGQTCSSYFGTVPYDDIGIPRGTASDDYGNLFGYGVNQLAADATVMSLDVSDTSAGGEAEQLADSPGSYFYNRGAPAFDLFTPPTESVPGDATKSYEICGRNAANDCSGTNDVVNEYIQAVIVAFNENGDQTTITNCNSSARSVRESENCDADMRFTKGVFNDTDFDDQLETISAYEIKQQVDLRPNGFDSGFAFEDYEYIVNKDLTSTNDFNTGTKEAGTDLNGDGDFEDTGDVYGDSLYVTGDIDSSINFQAGSNKLKVEGNVNAGVNGGDDVDYFIILSNVESGGSISTEKGIDTVEISGSLLYKGDVNLGQDNDTATIGGSIGGTLDAGTGADTVTVRGDITGTVNLGNDGSVDILILYGDLIRGEISGGPEDILKVTATEAEWNQVYNDPTVAGTITGGVQIEYGYTPP